MQHINRTIKCPHCKHIFDQTIDIDIDEIDINDTNEDFSNDLD